MTTVALIEDDDDYRARVERLLAETGRFEVIHSCGSAEAGWREIPRRLPQVVLVDINLPDSPGQEMVALLHEKFPSLRCVVLSTFDDADHLFSALQAGAAGYLLKSEPPQEIVAALDELLAGGAPMSRPIAKRVLASFVRPAVADPGENVTVREREILDHLSRGLAYKEIAAALGISSATVKNHLYRIYEKLAVRSRTEAVVKWLAR